MNPFSPFYSNCELPMFERAGMGDWARYLIYQITQSGTAGRDALRFIGTRSLVHLRHYKERGLSKGEYVVADLHRPGDQGDSTVPFRSIYLRIERGGPEPEHMAAIELHLRDFASRQERYAARDSVEIIHALPSTDELIAQAVWGEKARHPTLIQLALACFDVHKADPGCFWGKAQSFFFAANVVMLLAEEFGVEYQRISHTAGMWAGFCIYSAPPHAADTLRVTFKQDIKMANR
ncbi:hypothetical protein EWM64_g7296 [Hericium alpestre]|uniref:Uncharacterized protein n=1 Tax=Hericium alpestre TaxID=135208 RepID=A0A4Y9ZQ49_9AGAM|nr:hypothetical protein EWM64_g7296 [Hericium alpestre]